MYSEYHPRLPVISTPRRSSGSALLSPPGYVYGDGRGNGRTASFGGDDGYTPAEAVAPGGYSRASAPILRPPSQLSPQQLFSAQPAAYQNHHASPLFLASVQRNNARNDAQARARTENLPLLGQASPTVEAHAATQPPVYLNRQRIAAAPDAVPTSSSEQIRAYNPALAAGIGLSPGAVTAPGAAVAPTAAPARAGFLAGINPPADPVTVSPGQAATQPRESLRGFTSQSTNPVTGGQVITMRTVTPGTAAPAPSTIAAAELQRRSNFATLQGRGIQPPGSGILTPTLPPGAYSDTPAAYGPTVTRELRRTQENPNRAEFDRRIRLAGQDAAGEAGAFATDAATTSPAEQALDQRNTFLGSVVAKNYATGEAAVGRAGAAQTAAEAQQAAAAARAGIAPHQAGYLDARANDLAARGTTYGSQIEANEGRANRYNAAANLANLQAADPERYLKRPGDGRNYDLVDLKGIAQAAKAVRDVSTLKWAMGQQRSLFEQQQAGKNQPGATTRPSAAPTTPPAGTMTPPGGPSTLGGQTSDGIQFKDGDVKTINGHSYQRVNGAWHPIG
jgi:hypothetical protein